MKFRRRKPRETIDINLVSLIDVVFILLLFFVVTTTFTRETQMRVDLPQSVTGASADDVDKKHVDITINAEGTYSVNNTLLADSKLDTLIDALQKESGGDTSLPFPSALTARRLTSRSSPRWMPRASWVSLTCA